MAGYEMRFDDARGTLICCIKPDFEDAESAALCRELSTAIRARRSDSCIRLLWDNRANRVLAETTSITLKEIMAQLLNPSDRVAILVSTNIAKSVARRSAEGHVQIFASESAAYLWLSITTPISV